MKIDIKVDGMNCMGCVTSLATRIRNLDGVEFADIDLPTSTAIISYNDQLVSLQEIKQTIYDTGYKVVK